MRMVWSFNHLTTTNSMDGKPARLAAYNGHTETLKWLHNDCHQLMPYIHECAAIAAAQGHNHVLTLLHDINPHCVKTAAPLCSAAKNGHVETLEWLRLHGGNADGETKKLITSALFGGHIPALDWLKENGFFDFRKINHHARCAAARTGKLQALEWLEQNGCALDYHRIAITANYCGQNAILQWAHDRGARLSLATARRHRDIAREGSNETAEKIFSDQINRKAQKIVADALAPPRVPKNRITLKWVLGL